MDKYAHITSLEKIDYTCKKKLNYNYGQISNCHQVGFIFLLAVGKPSKLAYIDITMISIDVSFKQVKLYMHLFAFLRYRPIGEIASTN